MSKIIVITDFSESARNALNYACAFFGNKDRIEIMLVNIGQVPTSYSGDGVAMAAISDTLESRVEKLQAQAAEAGERFPNAHIRYKAVIGSFVKTLKALIEEEQARLIFLGTPAEYGEIFAWDTDTLSAMTELPIPVLAIPTNVSFTPITKIAFASIPGGINSVSPIESLKRLVKYTGAELHVISVVVPGHEDPRQAEAESTLKEQLADVNPVYHIVSSPHVVKEIGHFVAELQAGILVVRPRKHGIWYNLFHKSYTKELARLNTIPVMALHNEWELQ